MEEIKISHLFQVFWKNKKRFFINAIIVFVLSCAYILCIPRYYTSEVLLAPETESMGGLNSLTSLASSFGFNIDAGGGVDAISPELYPDLFKSTDFVVGLLGIKVHLDEPEMTTDYFDYLLHYQKQTPWGPTVHKIKSFLTPKKKERKRVENGDGVDVSSGLNPFMLTESEDMIVRAVKSNIKCAMDKKTGVLSITVRDQDPVISAVLADSAKSHLQDFITIYRTNKARIDAEYYAALCDSAQMEYEQAIKAYGKFADQHTGSTLRQSYVTRRDELEADMQSKLTSLVALRQQLQTAKGKVQERTPAFTILQSATVPVKAAGPKRVLFVLFMTFLSFFLTYLWLIRNRFYGVLGFELNED